MAGRVLGGIATSLLFSAFEAWVVAEHFARGFDEKWLGDTFSKVCGCMRGACLNACGKVWRRLAQRGCPVVALCTCVCVL